MLRLLAAAALVAAFASTNALAQAGTISTFAGGAPTPHASTTAGPMALDAAGNLYLPGDNQIIKVTPAGVVSAITVPANASFTISCVAVDAQGDVHYGHNGPTPIFKVTPQGTVSTSASGPFACNSLAFDPAGNLYIASPLNRKIYRREAGSDTVTAVAGNGTFDPPVLTGPATATNIGYPYGLVADTGGAFYFSNGSQILHVNAAGQLTHVALAPPDVRGDPTEGASDSGVLIPHMGFWRDASGDFYVPGFMNHRVYRISGGKVYAFAGTGSNGPGIIDNVTALSATLSGPRNVVRDAAGNTFIVDNGFSRIRKVNASGTISSLPVGLSANSGNGGPATSAALGNPIGVAIAPDGRVAIGDLGSPFLREVSAAGVISSPAVGLPTFAAGVAYDAANNLYVSDIANARILKVTPAAVVSTYAGGNGNGFAGDGGPATSAKLSGARGLVVDGAGNLYIADHLNKRVRKVAPNGVITTVAGNGTGTFIDGSLATNSGLSPYYLALDGGGNLLIAEDGPLPGQAGEGHRVLRLDTMGVLRRIAGTGQSGLATEGVPAISSKLMSPAGLAVDPSGNIYLAETNGHRVLVIRPDGLLFKVAGTGTMAYSGDGGPAAQADLAHPSGLAWDPAGSLLVADMTNKRVRRIQVADTTPDVFAFAPATGAAVATAVESAALTPTGLGAAATVTIANGEYSIGCTGTYTSAAGTLAPGQSICVRHTSAAANNADVTTTVNIGGLTATFVSTTVVGPGSVSLSATTLDFGGQSMNTTSAATSVTITNTGGNAVSLNALLASAGFGGSSACTTIAAGASCAVDVAFTPTTQGAATGTLTLRLSSGNQSVALAGTGERSLATHYYRAILRRAPDTQGKNFWEGEATRLAQQGANPNEAWFSMAMAFFFSPEYVAFNRSNSDFLVDLYKTFFNRPPDPSGAVFWSGQLEQGLPREVALASFMFSTEFSTFAAAIFGAPQVRAEVDVVMDFYRGLLARMPENVGLSFWVQRFRTAQCTTGTAAQIGAAIRAEADAMSYEFLNGVEYANRARGNAQFVGDLYNAFLRRGGEIGGVNFYVNELNGNLRTREKARVDFLTSFEFQQRVQRVINQGCLP